MPGKTQAKILEKLEAGLGLGVEAGVFPGSAGVPPARCVESSEETCRRDAGAPGSASAVGRVAPRAPGAFVFATCGARGATRPTLEISAVSLPSFSYLTRGGFLYFFAAFTRSPT